MDKGKDLVKLLSEKGLRLVTAESCTAGLAADLIAQVPGASKVFWGGFVTYTIEAKARMLGLDEARIRKYGAVSRETACAMAEGALRQSGADIAVSVTGLAGPESDESGQPVGTVWIGLCRKGGQANAKLFHYTGDRNSIRAAAADEAIGCVLRRLHDRPVQA
jgi:PncC family amidohydrolase